MSDKGSVSEKSQHDQEEVLLEAGDVVVLQEEEQSAAPTAASLGNTEINDQVFEELRLGEGDVREVQVAWTAFVQASGGLQSAGEAVYAAIFDSAPSLQSLFKTPRAVMALRFVTGVNNIVSGLGDPAGLKTTVETLGFQHLDLEVTAPRVITFRDAILDLLAMEMGDNFTSRARDALQVVLNWVGGAYIYIRLRYADRLRILARSWAKVTNAKEDEIPAEGEEEEAKEGEEKAEVAVDVQSDVEVQQAAATNNRGGESPMSKGRSHKNLWNLLSNRSNTDATLQGKEGSPTQSGSLTQSGEFKGGKGLNAANVPRTYNEMFRFNAAVMGFAGSVWMDEVLQSFDTIVRNASKSYRLAEECDVLSLRIAKCTKGPVNLVEYKNVMLASLRSLLPSDWNSAHEVAWSWLWENVERMLKSLLGKPAVQEKALSKLIASLDENQKNFVRREVYAEFFLAAPAGQEFFKQSTTRLYWIADKVVSFTLEMYQDPRRMVEDLSALGLRHVGFGIPTELFGPFVNGAVTVIRKLTSDVTAEEAFRWSITLVSRILVRAINEGSTLVMKAINANSPRQVRKAISVAPRGKRATWMLNITVGTQSISPLMWSIESGAIDAAKAMLEDLLTIRADRDRYYYGADELFERHPEIFRHITQEAPVLLRTLLDGLVWRSRLTEKGTRRVNYYFKNLLLDQDGNFSDVMSCIAGTRDAKLACHPIMVFMSDLVWQGVSFRMFMIGKMWLLVTVIIFITSQAILRAPAHTTPGQWARYIVFGMRMFTYTACMGELWYTQVSRCIKDIRKGALTRIYSIKVPTRYLDDYQETVSLLLASFLALMISHCPIFYCIPHYNDGNYEGAGTFSETCPEFKLVLKRYGIFSMASMLLFFLRLVDLTVLSNRLCAYVLMCGHVAPEVALYVGAVVSVVVAFACAVSALDQEIKNFSNFGTSLFTLSELSLNLLDPSYWDKISKEVWLYAVCVIFVILVFMYLTNLLIAQISASFQAVYDDILGYARVRRMLTVCNTMPLVGKDRWRAWVAGLGLDERLEFNEGDVGLAGGMQVREAANLNPTTADTIKRVGGTTSQQAPWPEEKEADDGEAGRMDRIEKLMQRCLKQTNSGGRRRGGRSGNSGSSGSNQMTESEVSHGSSD